MLHFALDTTLCIANSNLLSIYLHLYTKYVLTSTHIQLLVTVSTHKGTLRLVLIANTSLYFVSFISILYCFVQLYNALTRGTPQTNPNRQHTQNTLGSVLSANKGALVQIEMWECLKTISNGNKGLDVDETEIVQTQILFFNRCSST